MTSLTLVVHNTTTTIGHVCRPSRWAYRNSLLRRSAHFQCYRKRHQPYAKRLDVACQSQREPLSKDEWRTRAKFRAIAEIAEAGKRFGHSQQLIQDNFVLLESLLPGFTPNLETLKASEWAKLAMDVNAVALRIILLKQHYPGLDISKLAMTHPRFLLTSCEEIEQDAQQVKQMLATALDIDAIINELPRLLSPKTLLSILVTLRKWYPDREDPVQVLQADPDVVRRMESCDIPLEPVFWDGTRWTAATYSGKSKMHWQKWVRTEIYKEKPQDA